MIKSNIDAVSDGIKKYSSADEQSAENSNASYTRSSLAGLENTAMDPNSIYDEDEIAWADPDPDTPMPGLDEIWAIDEVPDNWLMSYSEAMRLSRVSGKPVIIWFDQSIKNPASSALHNELFSAKKFENWAKDNVILLRIDKNIKEVSTSDTNKYQLMLRKREYVQRLREQYNVLGSPVVIILSARGTQISKNRGYKPGNASFFFGQIKSAHATAVADYAQWREEFENRGYRMWHDNRGRKVFAKPIGLKSGEITFKDPEGKKSKTKLSKLSQNDQDWVANYIRERRK